MAEQARRPYERQDGGPSMQRENGYYAEAMKLRMQLAALVGACDAIRWCFESGQTPSASMLTILYDEANKARQLYALEEVRP